jgi:hypothetical protein
MRSYTTVFAVLCMSMTALAGKMERDLMTKQVAPAVASTQASFKAKCGCAVKIIVDDKSLTSMDELRATKHMAEHVQEGVEKYCTDAPSKKAVCQLQTLTFTKGKPAGFTFKAGAGIATTDGQTSCSWEQMTKVLDR